MTVIPDKHTFTIWQGTSFTETLAVYSDAAGTTPKNLRGYTAEMIIRNKPNGTPVSNPASGSVTTYVDGANGKVTLSLTPQQTAAITWKTAVYDLTITKSSNPSGADSASIGTTDALLYGGIKVQGV